MFKFKFSTLVLFVGAIVLSAPRLALADQNNDVYRIGSEWGKKIVDRDWLETQSKEAIRAARATVSIRGASGFYIGKIDGEHIVATNQHVIGSERACLRASMEATALGIQFRCKKHLGAWPSIDFSLQSVEVLVRRGQEIDELERTLSEVAKNLSFNRSLTRGMPLVTVGYGQHQNMWGRMVAGADEDCLVFSADGEYRLISDPDQLNPGAHKVWSFATGCDGSHGDSGSAFVDRTTSEVVGILWTGAFPKEGPTQNSQVLAEWLREGNDEMIWKQLNFGVPAQKIADVLFEEIASNAKRAEPTMDAGTVRLLRAILADGGAVEPEPEAQPQN